MDFIHQPYYPGKTIAAIASPPGEGGVAIIRVSGRDAIEICQCVFSGSIADYKSHTVHFGKIKNQSGEVIDEGLLILFLGSRSYTGEDTVELHCHGGRLVTRRVLEAVLAAGAHAASPGEFTLKAFMNGKIDLTQAEAIQSLISAKSELALDAAGNQLQGMLSKKIKCFQGQLTHIAAILEAWIDFPEEGLEFTTMEVLSDDLNEVCSEMEKLIATFHQGKILHDGLSLCLVGCPNVGKSSLLNALVDKDRAIVSPVPGTTRDVLEEYLYLNGVHLKVSDTAGIRHSAELIEQEGIRRSKRAMLEADLVLFVLDASRGLTPEDREIVDIIPKERTILVWNKIDLPHETLMETEFPHVVFLSAKDGSGLEELHKVIDVMIWQHHSLGKDEVVITNIRHKEALAEAILSARCVFAGLKNGISPEFLSLDMRQSLQGLGKIIGTNITEDILSEIFSTFCIGK